MTYTTLRVSEAGVLLFEEHLRRLSAGGDSIVEQFRLFAIKAKVGVYSLTGEDQTLRVVERRGSGLSDEDPIRYVKSPYHTVQGTFPKPRPEGLYAPVRLNRVTTLLMSEDGSELLESCSATVVSVDPNRLVFPPADRPRVASTTERFLRREFESGEAPLLREGSAPLALINAVKGVCLPHVPGRVAFPSEMAQALSEAIERTAAREPSRRM